MSPTQFTLPPDTRAVPPDTRAVGTGDPPADVNGLMANDKTGADLI